jgi:hypothetical protein
MRDVKDRPPGESWLSEHATSIGSWLVLALIEASAVWWYLRPTRLDDIQAWEWCRAGYEQALTLADSSAVDNRRPIVSRGQAEAALTCRTLRGSGRFR